MGKRNHIPATTTTTTTANAIARNTDTGAAKRNYPSAVAKQGACMSEDNEKQKR